MSSPASRYLTKPLLTSPGVPLRVAVYSRVAEGIRSGVFPSGEALPRETELALSLGVSRTVVREALMLLQEDGLIVTRRGVGRFVADAIPSRGLEELRPLEDVLAGTGTIEVQGGELELQPVTDFVTTHLALEASEEMWFRESLVRRDGEPVALVQEYLPAGRRLAEISGFLHGALQEAAAEQATLLSALGRQAGQLFSSALCQLSANVAGPTRADLLEVEPDASLLVLTQTAAIDGRPAYLAKSAVSPAAGQLSVHQAIPA